MDRQTGENYSGGTMNMIKLAKSLRDKSKKEIIDEFIELYKENEKFKKSKKMKKLS